MILDSEASLHRWIASELKSTCDGDADPEALASYVVALLKHHDKKGDVLKNHCDEQLRDFLSEHTGVFMESLFRVLNDGSYKAGDTDDVNDVSGMFFSN